jgi:hypothetical protein
MIFFTGQAMLISMMLMSGLYSRAFTAASEKVSGLLPKSCRPVRRSFPVSRNPQV